MAADDRLTNGDTLMARLVRLTEMAPMKIEAKDIPEGKALSICTCGLSRKFPLCDGAHKSARATEQPGTLYVYNHDRTAVIETRPDLPDSPVDHPPQP
jgi:CDGSH-type Zn-finger protein